MLGTVKDLNLSLSPGLEECQEGSAFILNGMASGRHLQTGPWEAGTYSFYTGVGERLPGSMCLLHGRGKYKGPAQKNRGTDGKKNLEPKQERKIKEDRR